MEDHGKMILSCLKPRAGLSRLRAICGVQAGLLKRLSGLYVPLRVMPGRTRYPTGKQHGKAVAGSVGITMNVP
jgi:hypothetical protein